MIAVAYAKRNLYFLFIMTAVNGFFSNACLPLCYEIVTETTYPLSEALSAGYVHALYSIVRLILKGLNKWLDSKSFGIESYSYTFIMILLIFSAFVLMFFS